MIERRITVEAKEGHESCDGCRYDLGGGCCSINSEFECRDGGGFELYEPREDGNHV